MPWSNTKWNLSGQAIISLICVTVATGCISGDPNINTKTRLGFAQGRANQFLKEAGHDDIQLYQDYRLVTSERTWFDPTTRTKHRYTIYDYLRKTDGAGPKRFVIAYDAVTRRAYLRDDPRSNVNLSGWDEFQRRALAQQPGDYRDLVNEAGKDGIGSPNKDLGMTKSKKLSKR